MPTQERIACKSSLRPRYRFCAPLLLAVLALPAAGLAIPASAATPPKPTVPAGYTITKVAVAPNGATNCDDLVSLEGHLFMGCQNAATSNGGGTSTVVEYTPAGALVKTWSITDKVDGMGADPLHHRVIATLNEDANSHLATITPAASGNQVTYYRYSPDPRGTSTPVALRTGGGTDHVSVDAGGHVLITASHAGTKTGTAVFKAVLTAPSTATGMGTVTLSPTFADNATATNAAASGGTVKLALGDVDSGAIVPASSPRFAGSYVIDDQTALQLVFASDLNSGTGLKVLKTPFGLDDIRWATSNGGTMYVVDKGAGTTGHSALYKVTGPFTTGTTLASNDGQGDQVVKVNLNTGALTPLVQGLNTTKGLVYLDPSGSEAQLALAASPAAATTKGGGSDSTLLIVLIVIAALVIAGGGAYALSRRRPTAG